MSLPPRPRPSARTSLRSLLRQTAWLLCLQAALTAGWELFQQERENRYLASVLASWQLPAEPLARVLAVRDHVREAVDPIGLDVNAPRPFLRGTAAAALKSGKGFCGADSRVVIRLLGLLGIPARRIYLWGGPHAAHVLAEALVEGHWMVVDGQRGKPDCAELPACMAALGMTRWTWWSPRLLRLIGDDPFPPVPEHEPPRLYTRLTESPFLLRGLLALCELFACGGFGLLLATARERSPVNADARTIEGFGYEWKRFDQTPVSEAELKRHFDQYFRVFPWERLPEDAVGFDAGCGSGRWARFVAPRVGTLHCIDASPKAIEVARSKLSGFPNCRFEVATVADLPFPDASMDFGYSLGVLHHVPDTEAGIKALVRKLKPGAPLLLYLYYAFDNRPWWYRALWRASDLARRVISKLPVPLKFATAEALALTVYWPLARTSRLAEAAGAKVGSWPLSYYRHSSLYVMRNDALDRFGTRLELRYTAAEVRAMMEAAGLGEVRISEEAPYWCAVGERAGARRGSTNADSETRDSAVKLASLVR